MIENYSLIDPENLSPDTVFIQKFDHPLFEGKEVFFFRRKIHIIIYIRDRFAGKTTGETEFLSDQIEIPVRAIQWIVDTIEIKFFKPPSQGGLPVGKFHHCKIMEGEELCINRSVISGEEGVSGYRLINLSRRSHMAETGIQEFTMPDPLLFDHGLIDFLKILAQKSSGLKYRRQ